MKIGKVLNESGVYNDWSASIIIEEGEDWEEFDCGIHRTREEALSILDKVVSEFDKFKTLDEIRKHQEKLLMN